MAYLLDTNVLIIYNRSAELARRIEDDYRLFDGTEEVAISLISVAESRSLLFKNGVGQRRVEKLTARLAATAIIDLNFAEIIEKYIEIDAYSQRKHPTLNGNFSARNMGKNDLWIAATASAFGMTLVTTDRDFMHLDGIFLSVEYVDITTYR